MRVLEGYRGGVIATLVMQGSREKSVERSTVAPKTGDLSLVLGMVLLFLTTGACELVLIGAHTVMARVLGH